MRVASVSDSQETGRRQLWLRPLGPGDVPLIAEWLEDVEDLAMFDRRVPVPLDATAMEAEWRDDLEYKQPRSSYWFKIDDDQGRALGMVGLTQINYVHGGALQPIFVSQAARGRGIGLRSRAMMLDLAFDQLRLVRIASPHRADNEASRRLNEACGFTLEGCVRNGYFAGGRHVDHLLYGILVDEWRAHRKELRARLSSDLVVTLGGKPEGVWSWPRVSQSEDTPSDER